MTTLHATAGYLPGLAPADVQWQALRFGSGPSRLEVAVPVLSRAADARPRRCVSGRPAAAI